uniref:DUF4283 domain-containing protein n=1 Tax=Tanacetum cinerariifolium TaxID=118510 RepID=A0A699I3X1_TANCI|nr:hypothetical protein [Tanacetum cinerariifolium]
MIRRVSIFLDKWSSFASLFKEDLSRVPVWVKFHDIPLVAYTSDGLSLIATKITPKRVVDKIDKGKGGSSGENDEGFVEVKKKKSGDNNGGNKIFKSVSVKLKPQYHPKAKQSTDRANQKTTLYVGKKNVLTSGNGTFSLSKSFVALNVENSVDYSDDQDSEHEIEYVDNEMASYLASKPSGVGYGNKSLLEKCRETYLNDDYDPYDDDMNRDVFDSSPPRRAVIFDDIVATSYIWSVNRCDSPRMIRRVSIFLNKWSSFASLLKEDLSRVPVWVKFHDVPLVAYTSDGLSLIATKITPKRVVDKIDQGKGGSSGVDDEGFVEVDYSGDQDSEHGIEYVDNEMASYLASKPSEVGYGNKSLLEKCRETYLNDDYDPYDDDMYEGQDIPDNIQSICDNWISKFEIE